MSARGVNLPNRLGVRGKSSGGRRGNSRRVPALAHAGEAIAPVVEFSAGLVMSAPPPVAETRRYRIPRPPAHFGQSCSPLSVRARLVHAWTLGCHHAPTWERRIEVAIAALLVIC